MEEPQVKIRQVTANELGYLNANNRVAKIARTAIFLCLRGSGRIMLNEEYYDIEANSLLVYFPYSTLKILYIAPDSEGLVISCDLDTIQPLMYKISDFNSLFRIRQNPYMTLTDEQRNTLFAHIRLLADTIRRLEAEEQEKSEVINQPVREIFYHQRHLLGISLMLEIISCYAGIKSASTPGNRRDQILQKFISMLYGNFRKEHEVRFYADAQFLTCRYFSSIIKEKSGKTPSEWISSALLVEAKQLLLGSSKSVKEISESLNFPNQSYFGKWFKNLVGMSPLEFKGLKIKEEDEVI